MKSTTKHLALSLAAAAALTLTACATLPPPTDQLARAEAAIKRAEEARVSDYASPELSSARDKLVAARNAVTAQNMPLAARLAEQAQLDAEVAAAKAEAAKAEATIAEMRKANQALQQETQRNSTTPAPIILPAPTIQPGQ